MAGRHDVVGPMILAAHRVGHLHWAQKMLNEHIAFLTPEDGLVLIESAIRVSDTCMLEILLPLVPKTYLKKEMSGWILSTAKQRNLYILRLLLLYHERNADLAMKWAVRYNKAHIVILLAAHVSEATRQEALVPAHKTHHIPTMEALICGGTDIDAHDGYLLIESIRQKDISLVRRLLDLGANPDIQNGLPLRVAMEIYDARMVEILLNSGAVDTFCDTIVTDVSTRQLIQRWRTANKTKRLVHAIRESSIRFVFQWEKVANTISRDPKKALKYTGILRHHFLGCRTLFNYVYPNEALEINTIPAKGMGHREFCAHLAYMSVKMDQVMPELGGVDLLGNDLCSLPKWKLVLIHGRIYTLNDLAQMLTNHGRGPLTCPYTRIQLPSRFINEHLALVRKYVMPNALCETNLISMVRETPMMTKFMEMRMALMYIFTKLSYVPSPDLILHASHETIEDILRNLYLVMSDSPRIFGFVTSLRRYQITSNCDIQKKREMLIQLLHDIVFMNDMHASTRGETVAMLLRHYNIDGSPRNDEEDTLAWILGLIPPVSFHDQVLTVVNNQSIPYREPEYIRLLGTSVPISAILNSSQTLHHDETDSSSSSFSTASS